MTKYWVNLLPEYNIIMLANTFNLYHFIAHIVWYIVYAHHQTNIGSMYCVSCDQLVMSMYGM